MIWVFLMAFVVGIGGAFGLGAAMDWGSKKNVVVWSLLVVIGILGGSVGVSGALSLSSLSPDSMSLIAQGKCSVDVDCYGDRVVSIGGTDLVSRNLDNFGTVNYFKGNRERSNIGSGYVGGWDGRFDNLIVGNEYAVYRKEALGHNNIIILCK